MRIRAKVFLAADPLPKLASVVQSSSRRGELDKNGHARFCLVFSPLDVLGVNKTAWWNRMPCIRG